MNIKRWLRIALLPGLTLLPICLSAQTRQIRRLTAAEAKDHISEQATVCGEVASTRYVATTRGKPTFLNLDKPYPYQVFTSLICGDYREKFGTPEEKHRDNQVCVTGKIAEYRGALEFVVSDPQNIEVQKQIERDWMPTSLN